MCIIQKQKPHSGDVWALRFALETPHMCFSQVSYLACEAQRSVHIRVSMLPLVNCTFTSKQYDGVNTCS